jgi:hypothetical protein
LREPTEADMRALRDLLMATGGSIDELASWSGCVLDTDDDAAAMQAYDARRCYAAMQVERIFAKQLATDRATTSAGQTKKRGPKYLYLDTDSLVVRLAEKAPGASVKARIRHVVKELWSVLRLGNSEESTVRRIFSRLRDIDFAWSPLAKMIAPRAASRRGGPPARS